MLPHQKRILFFNPKIIYDRIIVDRYARTQSISITKMFPVIEYKICRCGCGQKLEGRRTAWANDSCMSFAQSVWGIINGHSEIISFYLRKLNPQWACCKCGLTDSFKEQKNGLTITNIHKDHIVAVVNGGGGCWLDNYQLLCEKCHQEKTGKFKIARVPYTVTGNDIIDTKEKSEALLHAQFISKCFNNSEKIINQIFNVD